MDTNTVLRDGTSNLTADETLTSALVGPMVKPLWLHVVVPSVSSGDTLDVELEFCAASASTTQISNMNMKQITAAGHYAIPFFTAHEYVQVKLNVTADSTAALSMGATKVWIDATNRYNGPYNS